MQVGDSSSMCMIASTRVGWEADDVIERILHGSEKSCKVEKIGGRRDMFRPTQEKRVPGVEQLRRTLFDEDPTQSRLEQILAVGRVLPALPT